MHFYEKIANKEIIYRQNLEIRHYNEAREMKIQMKTLLIAK